MKNLIPVFVYCLMLTQLTAQDNQITTTNPSQKGTMKWRTSESNKQKSAIQLVQDKAALQLTADDNLNLLKTSEDNLGFRHYRYQQMYKNIPVEGAIFFVHEKNNIAEIANGSLISDLDISATPSISETSALQSALEHVNSNRYAWQELPYESLIKDIKNDVDATFYPTGELVILDPSFEQNASNCRLAYKFDIYSIAPLMNPIVYVDALTGEVLFSIEQIHSCTGRLVSANTNYSGEVLFTACESDGVYTLGNIIGGGMQVFDGNYGDNMIPFTDTPMQGGDTPVEAFGDDPTAVEVLWAMEKTHAYYLNEHGRNSIDGGGKFIRAWVHHGTNVANAYWNPGLLAVQFGDGDNIEYNSFTSPDIVAHELTHGVNAHAARLVNLGESGALNESFADIFGELVEGDINDGVYDWIFGAHICIPEYLNGIRNLANPKDPSMDAPQPDTYGKQYWSTTGWSSIDAHINNGVQNYWFYLLAMGGSGQNDNGLSYNINPIGVDAAAKIAYRNLTVYLTPFSNYADARASSIQAATDLYGTSSPQIVQTVIDAWDAVGVTTGLPLIGCAERDYIALRALYLSTNGNNWTDNTGWPTAAQFNANPTMPVGTDMSTWYGITLNEEGCVICIDMDGLANCTSNAVTEGNNLIGTIPSEIGSLGNLEYLRLQYNYLSGSIPSELGNLTNLIELGLQSNQLTGNIPPDLGNLEKIYSLNLFLNQLTGSIPSELGNLSNLWDLSVSRNLLTGNIPPELGKLVNLRYLFLNNNQLSGNIPAELGNLSTIGQRLQNNNLSGCYDDNLLNLCNQGTSPMSLSGNNLDALWGDFCNSGAGTCIPGYSTCRYYDSLALVTLYNMTGGPSWNDNTNWLVPGQPVYKWYGVALNENGCVRRLSLGSNGLSGSLPATLVNLQELERLDLYGNQLTGSIPTDFGNLENLIYLNLRYNSLTESIPNSLGNLSSLIRLNLSHNELTGTIPKEIGNLHNLAKLNFAHNNIEGEIPPELGNLNKLSDLILDYNEISGNIPASLGNLCQLKTLDLDANELIGNIPRTLSSLTQLTTVHLTNNQLSGCYFPELSNLCEQIGTSGISFGNNFDATWEDFCSTRAGGCFDAYIWPGDFNNDGIANYADFLRLGYVEGGTGYARPQATDNWEQQGNFQWNSFYNGINGVYADGNGDGVINFDDSLVLKKNYGLTHGAIVLESDDGQLEFRLEYDAANSDPDNGVKAMDLYVVSKSGEDVWGYGIGGEINFEDLDIVSVTMDISSSALQPDGDFNILVDSILHFAMTRTDYIDVPIDGSIAHVVVMEDLQGGGGGNARIPTGGGSMTFANGADVSVAQTDLNISFPTTDGSVTVLPVTIISSDPQCGIMGEAIATAYGENEPYTYNWSTGETTSTITNLSAGLYTVTVSDANQLTNIVTVEINPPEPVYDEGGNLIECTPISQTLSYVNFGIYVLLEGAYNSTTQEMGTALNTERGLLPGQTPIGLTTPTPSGQPYNQPPWNYDGTEGQNWTDNSYSEEVVDWILVSFRRDIFPESEIAKTAALLLKDGSVYFPNRNVLPINTESALYVVVEHRNHMAAMTRQPISIINNTLTYDFRLNDSYTGSIGLPLGTGQKQLPGGSWCMFAGDCNQLSDIGYNITGADIIIWTEDNGTFGQYLQGDMNLDGDVNGADKWLWPENNGVFSAVPR